MMAATTQREADLTAIIARQDERIAQLEAQIRDLTRARWNAPLAWGLTTQEEAVLAFLVSRETASKTDLHGALYADDPQGGPDIKIIDVYICKLRRKIAAFGWSVETVWGRGWAIPADQRAAMRTGAVSRGREA